MGRHVVSSFLVLASLCPVAAAAEADQDTFDSVARPFLEAHCVRCHMDAGEQSQGLDLSAPDSSLDVVSAADEWDWLLERVELSEMPPPGEAVPSEEERLAFVAWLRGALTAAAGNQSVGGQRSGTQPLPPVGLKRLTRSQYTHAVRDLLGIQIDASRYLPEDVVGHGFDHVASAQTLSEESFIGYLEAAEAAAERAVPIGPSRTQRVNPAGMTGGTHSRGTRYLSTNGAVKGRVSIPRPGVYRIRAEVFGFQAGSDPCRATLFLDGESALPKDPAASVSSDEDPEANPEANPQASTQESAMFDVPATAEAPQIIEGETRVLRAGDLLGAVRFENDYYVAKTEDTPQADRNFAVRWIEVEGPLDEGEATLFMDAFEVGMPASASNSPASGSRPLGPALGTNIGKLAALLWRVPEIDPDSLDRLLRIAGPEAEPAQVLHGALVGMLSSPRFLFRNERPIAGAAADLRGSMPLDGPSMATRLAGLLWDSVPDEELLQGAKRLLDDEGLREVAQEMLLDERSSALARSFGDQWLQLRSVESKRAQKSRFPGFSQSLRASMLEETRRVVLASLRERRSVWEFIDGDETFVNAVLAEHYGLGSAPEGAARGGWWRASLVGTSRRGLVGHGSVLFATSEATRTSPVRRGKWVLDVLLGSAPPPPPPGVGNLPKVEEGAEPVSHRERLEVHRADPTCAACHARMDPIGFGLDLFDAVGAERSEDDSSDLPLDLHGAFPNGVEFTGPLELVQVLRKEDRFLEALTEEVLVYALGRGVERADRGALETIADQLDPDHPTLEGMLIGAICTDEFRRIAVLPAPTQNIGQDQ